MGLLSGRRAAECPHMKALLISSVMALPLLLTSCYTDGVVYDGGGGYRRDDRYYRGGYRDHYRDGIRVVERPVIVGRPRSYDWHDRDHRVVTPVYPGVHHPRYTGHRDVVVREVEVKHGNKYEVHKKKKKDDDLLHR